MKICNFVATTIVALASAYSAQALELKDLKQGRFEPVDMGCRGADWSDQHIYIVDNGKGYGDMNWNCDVVGRTKSGAYKMKCEDTEGGEDTSFSLPIKVKDKLTFSLDGRVFKWCAK